MNQPSHEPSDLISEYARAAEAWDEIVLSDAGSANPIFDRLHQLAKELRASSEGREGLERLTSHEAVGVRLLAGSDCLPFAPEIGEPVLEAIESFPGLHAVSAKYTLEAFRAGTLDMHW